MVRGPRPMFHASDGIKSISPSLCNFLHHDLPTQHIFISGYELLDMTHISFNMSHIRKIIRSRRGLYDIGYSDCFVNTACLAIKL